MSEFSRSYRPMLLILGLPLRSERPVGVAVMIDYGMTFLARSGNRPKRRDQLSCGQSNESCVAFIIPKSSKVIGNEYLCSHRDHLIVGVPRPCFLATATKHKLQNLPFSRVSKAVKPTCCKLHACIPASYRSCRRRRGGGNERGGSRD